MKKSFLLYLIMSVFLIGYCACDISEENLIRLLPDSDPVPDDIKSYG